MNTTAAAPRSAGVTAAPLSFELDCRNTLSRSAEDELGGMAAIGAIVDRAHAAGVTVEAFAAWALAEARKARAEQAQPAPAPAPRADLPALRQAALRAMVDYLTAAQAEAARQRATRDLATAAHAVAEDAVATCRAGLLAEAAQAAADAIVAACPRGRVRASVYDGGRELYVSCGDAGATLRADDDADPRWDGVNIGDRDEGDPSSLRSLLDEIEELQADAQRVEDCITDARQAVAAWRTACEAGR